MSGAENLPPLKTAAAMDLDEIRPYLLDPREEYPEPFFLLEFNGIPFSPLGGIQAITGQKKNGKSFLIAQLMSAILMSGSDRVEEYLPGLKVPQRTKDMLGHEPRVLYVDTEMEKLNSAKVLRRVHWLCDWPMNEPQERFNVLWLRSVEKDEETGMPAHRKRLMLILKAVAALKPDAVFIDGTRDIIGDFNDNEESSQLVSQLMAEAQKRGICIWNALHLNPRPGNDDESKMRGHLGTELGNKVSDTLHCIKQKTANGVTFTVKQMDARGKDMYDWRFEVTDAAGALGVPKIFGSGQNLKKIGSENGVEADSREDIRMWLTALQDSADWPLSKNAIIKLFRENGWQTNTGKLRADIEVAIAENYLVQTTEKRNGAYLFRIGEELPF